MAANFYNGWSYQPYSPTRDVKPGYVVYGEFFPDVVTIERYVSPETYSDAYRWIKVGDPTHHTYEWNPLLSSEDNITALQVAIRMS